MVDVGQVLAIGGPTSVVGAIITLLVKAYFDSRRESREDKTSAVTNDGGIVDNARKVLELVTSATEGMNQRIIALEAENVKLKETIRIRDVHINQQDDKIARQAREIEWVREDLNKASKEIQELMDAKDQT